MQNRQRKRSQQGLLTDVKKKSKLVNKEQLEATVEKKTKKTGSLKT